MSINAYLLFNGNCREAVEYYAQVFRTEPPRFMTFGEAPMEEGSPLPEQARNLVMHTNLMIAGSLTMFSDVLPGMPFTIGNNFNLTVMSKDESEIRKSFKLLSEGGQVTMDLQKTFWSPCYGMVTDRFGIGWQFSLEK